MLMTQTMRWFGPTDPVSLAAIRQVGASEVVTALHDITNGEVWPQAAIAARRAMVEAAGLRWTVVESLPVDDAIKTRGPAWGARIDAYRQSLTNLAAEGIRPRDGYTAVYRGRVPLPRARKALEALREERARVVAELDAARAALAALDAEELD